MSDVIIKVENLSKRYYIGESVTNNNLREVMVHAIQAPIRRLMRSADKNQAQSKADRIIWALRDVTFEVREGEILGIIGRNGAGKSTLLKILSRITKPTSGSAEIYGRVGSLLEVGTGFHSELTGRENIYLNGTILGMKRAEIDRKFDEIVEFSEIAKFLDTPVKRYSSGMYVRLAFAVAAHLEPEVLIVDEVLAVGDAAFQKKCLGKMGSMVRTGRTILFVSHNMGAIQNLCETAILLEKGEIIQYDTTQKVVQRYFQTQSKNIQDDLQYHERRRPGSDSILRRLRIFADDFETTNIPMGGNLRIEVSFRRELPIRNIRIGIAIEDAIGQRVLAFSPSLQEPNLIKMLVCSGTFVCNVPKIQLLPGLYFITLVIADGSRDLDRIDQAGQFVVEAADVFGTGFTPEPSHGIYYQEANWSYSNDEVYYEKTQPSD